MFAIGLVHRIERPRHPAYAALDERETQSWKSFEHPRCAQARHRFDHRWAGVSHVIDDRASILACRARVHPGRDMKRDGNVTILDYRPQRVILRQIVIGMTSVV